MKTFKIVAFDSWTGAVDRMYKLLLPAFKEKNLSLMLVHIGPWGSDPGRPTREVLFGLPVRSIADYGHNSLDKILDEEKPDAVLFLSTQTFAHRAFNRYCMQRGIPTLHLYHGLVTVQAINGAGAAYKVNLLGHARFVAERLYKTFLRTLPCYAGALLKTNAGAGEWARFFADLMRMLGAQRAKSAAADARTTKCCVYTAADITHAIQTYGFDEVDVIPVGNIDLLNFGLTQAMIGSRVTQDDRPKKNILYIDTCLPATGFIFKDLRQFATHLRQTADGLAGQGFKMLLKPHPGHNLACLADELQGSGIEWVSKEDFIGHLDDCAACLVETTTLALVPALMGMPLLLANHGMLKDLRFGEALVKYPRAYSLKDLGQTRYLLRKDLDGLNTEALEAWIGLNAGPQPAADMPKRVAEVVANLITKGVE